MLALSAKTPSCLAADTWSGWAREMCFPNCNVKCNEESWAVLRALYILSVCHLKCDRMLGLPVSHMQSCYMLMA